MSFFKKLRQLFCCCLPEAEQQDQPKPAATRSQFWELSLPDAPPSEQLSPSEQVQDEHSVDHAGADHEVASHDEPQPEAPRQTASQPQLPPQVCVQPSPQRKNIKKYQRRANQRWCRLLTATKSRLAEKGLKDALGPHWIDFVAHANSHFQANWVGLFGSTMHCQGPLGIGQCPSQLSLDPTSESDLELLSSLHLDHSIPLETICSLWIEIIQSQRQPLSSWDEGVDGDLLCQLIFGVQDHLNLTTTNNPLWRANVQFRCYHAKKRSGCHDMTCRANSNMKLSINDLRA